MSKRTAFSRKCEQRHWRLRHEQEEAERQRRRMHKVGQWSDYPQAGAPFDARGGGRSEREWDGDAEEQPGADDVCG